MNISSIKTVSEIEVWLNANEKNQIKPTSKKQFYEELNQFLITLKFNSLIESDKKVVRKFLKKVTKYSDRQIRRVLNLYKMGRLEWKEWNRVNVRSRVITFNK